MRGIRLFSLKAIKHNTIGVVLTTLPFGVNLFLDRLALANALAQRKRVAKRRQQRSALTKRVF